MPVAAEEPAITAEELAMRNFLAATAAFAGDLDPAAAAEQAEVSPGVVSHAADEANEAGEGKAAPTEKLLFGSRRTRATWRPFAS